MKSILLILVKVCLGSFDRVQSLDEVCHLKIETIMEHWFSLALHWHDFS